MRLTGWTDGEKAEVNFFWHRLRPWADAAPGLYRLKHRYIIAPMSNGNIALMTNMAKNGGLPWDCILGAEVARHYKPDPESYLTAVALLGLTPEQVMMTAAPPGRPAGGAKGGAEGGLCAAPHGTRPRRHPGPHPRPIL